MPAKVVVGRAAPQNHVDVAVIVDDDVAALADAAFVHDERAESGRQRQAAVVRIARRQSRLRSSPRFGAAGP